jgi:hypothetical protein
MAAVNTKYFFGVLVLVSEVFPKVTNLLITYFTTVNSPSNLGINPAVGLFML